MPDYFVANGQSFNPLYTSLATPTTLTQGMYYDTGRYGQPPTAGAPFYSELEIDYDGVDGVQVARRGFRYLPIFATLVIAGSATYCNTTSKTLLASLRQLARYTVSLPGASYDGCRLKDCGTPTWENIANGCYLVIPCIWLQRSTTN